MNINELISRLKANMVMCDANNIVCNKIESIKWIRMRTGYGLKDAKDLYESVEQSYKLDMLQSKRKPVKTRDYKLKFTELAKRQMSALGTRVDFVIKALEYVRDTNRCEVGEKCQFKNIVFLRKTKTKWLVVTIK